MLRNGQGVEDVELAAPSTRLEGYPSFAHFIAKDSDAAIYRKFESLSARNLLYQQSELHELERQLDNFDREDTKDIGDEEAQHAARLWINYSTDSNDRACARRELQNKIGTKIRAYRMCITALLKAHETPIDN